MDERDKVMDGRADWACKCPEEFWKTNRTGAGRREKGKEFKAHRCGFDVLPCFRFRRALAIAITIGIAIAIERAVTATVARSGYSVVVTTSTRPAVNEIAIPARDGYPLAATIFGSLENRPRVVIINSATAVPQRFYRHFAAALANAGFTAVTYDYRGIEIGNREKLRKLRATARDWALQDLPGVVDWVADRFDPEKLFLVGHSFGGQVAGMYDRPALVDAMATMSAQSGHWRLQGGEQKLVVWLHTHVTLPLLSKVMGYMPMRAVGAGEDMPAGVALEWTKWCRHRDYILGDRTLPLNRYRAFTTPVLAYSISDDKWGTPRSVEAMMRAYPNVERRHLVPAEVGLRSIGHLGYFKPQSEVLWNDTITWFGRF